MTHLHLYNSEMRGRSLKTTLHNDKSNQFLLKILSHESKILRVDRKTNYVGPLNSVISCRHFKIIKLAIIIKLNESLTSIGRN